VVHRRGARHGAGAVVLACQRRRHSASSRWITTEGCCRSRYQRLMPGRSLDECACELAASDLSSR
jgi:hypothetical protein